jgi:DMSO/TMAO reductase YedYZ molybdopterin-dependent catalytic subunit
VVVRPQGRGQTRALDTQWKGVTIDALLDAAGVEPPAPYVTAFCDGGYTTHLAMEDLLDGQGIHVLARQNDGRADEVLVMRREVDRVRVSLARARRRSSWREATS